MQRFRLLLLIVAGAAVLLLARAMRRPVDQNIVTQRADVPSVPDPDGTPHPEPAPPPLAGYDELRAVDVAASIKTLDDPGEVRRILDYEEAHNQRVTVFRAAKARLRALEATSQETAET